jgi:hypothetical protein
MWWIADVLDLLPDREEEVVDGADVSGVGGVASRIAEDEAVGGADVPAARGDVAHNTEDEGGGVFAASWRLDALGGAEHNNEAEDGAAAHSAARGLAAHVAADHRAEAGGAEHDDDADAAADVVGVFAASWGLIARDGDEDEDVEHDVVATAKASAAADGA